MSFFLLFLQADKCLCYDSLVGVSPAGSCDSVTCPGNPTEQCGVVHMIVYRKGIIIFTHNVFSSLLNTSATDEGYHKNASCALYLISTFLLLITNDISG
jgi:hypothetical protein